MAAPSGTVWGSIVNNHGRIGIYTSVSSTATQTTVNVQAWFWTWYSCNDSYNSLYLDIGTGVTSATTKVASVEINHTRDWGEAWHTDNQTCLYNKTFTYTRGTSAATYKIYAKFAEVDYIEAPMYVNTSFTVPALASYTVSYNANKGTGAPSAQTKWYGKTLTLSSTKPTRTGYTFQGWATSASGGVSYSPGGSYTTNAAVTLYAVWKAHTYTVSYNANGGTGAPGNQTKTYDVTLKLSVATPTRTNYEFLGWATSATATTATYAPGGNYTANAAATLYAVWKLAYINPTIHHVSASRCDEGGNSDDSGTYGLIGFTWSCTYDVTSISISWASSSSGSGSANVAASGKSGTVSQIIGDGSLSPESTYTVTIMVADNLGDSMVTSTLNGSAFAIDFKNGGKGVSFGKPAELDNTADFAFDAMFRGDVYGRVVGMGNVTIIPENSDINDYVIPGCYAVSTHATAKTCINIPVKRAGRLEIYDAVGASSANLDSLYLYRTQRYIPIEDTLPVYERYICREGSYEWTYNNWYPTSLPYGSDYVVAQGTSNGWNYRKWNSGLCECYLGYAETVPSAGVGIKYGSITLPFTMANNTYYVGITPTKTANTNFAHDFNAGTANANEGRTTTAISYNYYYSSSAIYTVVFTVYIMGRWK